MARMDIAGVAAILEEALGALIAADALDIVLNPVGSELEAISEDWTLHLEGWPDEPLAWLALDDEPDDPAALTAAREAAIDAETLAASPPPTPASAAPSPPPSAPPTTRSPTTWPSPSRRPAATPPPNVPSDRHSRPDQATTAPESARASRL